MLSGGVNDFEYQVASIVGLIWDVQVYVVRWCFDARNVNVLDSFMSKIQLLIHFLFPKFAIDGFVCVKKIGSFAQFVNKNDYDLNII